MTIKFYNLQEQYQDQKYEIHKAMHDVGLGGQYFADQTVTQFENLISCLYNNASVVATNSGTSAIIVALKAANLPANSLVAIPSLTYIATANAVIAAGYQPALVDIDNYWLMNYDHLKKFLEQNSSISAVLLVDLYGQGVSLKKYKSLCDSYGVKLIIDAAQSFDLFYDYYHQIDYCDSLALSFNPLKNLGAMGNAGAVVSKNYTVDQLRRWCVHNKHNGDVESAGFNCRIDALQAAVLNVKYKMFDDNMLRKSQISWYYRQQLEHLVPMPERNYECTHMNYVFVVAPKKPDALRSALEYKNIEFGCHYEKSLNYYTAYKSFYNFCPKASALIGRCISLPNHWHLSDAEVDVVVKTVKTYL